MIVVIVLGAGCAFKLYCNQKDDQRWQQEAIAFKKKLGSIPDFNCTHDLSDPGVGPGGRRKGVGP